MNKGWGGGSGGEGKSVEHNWNCSIYCGARACGAEILFFFAGTLVSQVGSGAEFFLYIVFKKIFSAPFCHLSDWCIIV